MGSCYVKVNERSGAFIPAALDIWLYFVAQEIHASELRSAWANLPQALRSDQCADITHLLRSQDGNISRDAVSRLVELIDRTAKRIRDEGEFVSAKAIRSAGYGVPHQTSEAKVGSLQIVAVGESLTRLLREELEGKPAVDERRSSDKGIKIGKIKFERKSLRKYAGCLWCLGPLVMLGLFLLPIFSLYWWDESKLGPLQRAARDGDVTLVRALLSKGADINGRHKPKGDTALEIAASYAKVDVVRLLLESGANVNTSNFYGGTPLHFVASHFGNNLNVATNPQKTEIARMLLEHGADPNARNISNYTPLHEAVISMNPGMVRLLLKHGANPELTNDQGHRPIDRVDRWNSELYPKEAKEITAILSGWGTTGPSASPAPTNGQPD